MLPFIFDTSKGETPQSIAMKRELAARIMGQGARRAPQNVGEGWGSVLASIGDGISANVLNRRAGAAEASGQSAANSLRDQLIGTITGGQAFPPAPSSSFEQNATPLDPASARVAQAHGDGGGGMTAYQNAIASIESAGSGDYGAIGPTHPTLGRALGRYQVMEANIGPWSEKYLGKRITPEEFLQNPQYQDALFNGEFGSYVDKYGPEGAAQAWFGGEGGVGKVNRKDSLGTTIGAYTDKFRSALGGTLPAVAANEAMATGGLSNGLTPEMLQQWGASNYADPAAIQAEMRASQPPPVPQDMAPPMPPPRTIQDMPVAEPQPVQMAQAGGMDLSQIPAMAGGNAGVLQPGQQVPPDIGMLMQVVSHPFMDEGTKAFAMAQLQQHMQAQDPMRQLDMDYKRAQIGKLQADASGLGDAARVQSSVVLDDGSTVMVMNNGQRRVLSPTGDEVTGQAAADAIRSAREYTVQNQQDIYSGRRSGTLGADIELGGAAAGAKKGGEKTMEAGFSAWDDYNKLQGSIANIDEAVTALDNGAKSGIVYNMLPNVTEASASLKNAMDRMGLDVIGSVTFGALSEGEMRLAMETAVPRSLQPTELRNWLQRKRDAQEKASRTLADAAMFLTVPGNTINDWIAKNQGKGSSTQAPPGADGWGDAGIPGVRIRRKQ